MLGEVIDQIAPLLIGHRGVADFLVEVNMLQHAFERRIGEFESAESLVEPVANLMVQVGLQIRPSTSSGTKNASV
jgi:hypothetical protein